MSGRYFRYLKVNRRSKEKIVILSVLLISFLLAPFLNNLDMNGNLWLEDQNNLPNDKYEPFGIRTQSSLSEYSGVGAAQNVTEFGQGFFQNNEINVMQNGNASIIVPNNWEANEILSNVTNIYEYDKLWMNSTFDSSDLTSWTNTTTGNYDNYSYGWYNAPIGSNDSIYMTLNGSGEYWKGYDAFVNYTFYLDRDEIPYKNWEINFNFRFITSNLEWLSKLDQASKLLCRIKVGSIAQDFNLGKPSNYVNDTWYSDNIDVFTPELYDFDPPGTVNVLFGLACRGNIDLVNTGNLTTYFDNITLKLQTIPKPSQINLSITDNTNGEVEQISDLTGYGLGTVSFKNNWVGATGGTEHKFSFSSNSSGKLYINTDIFVNATSSKYTTIERGDKGSEFIIENGTRATWTMYFPVVIPGSYQTNYYFNVSKPINWNVTHLFDPYGNDKISQVLETSGIGNSTLVIPNDIIVNGRWKIEAESPNYVLNATIWKWAISTWEKNASFEISDKIKINATIDNYLNLIPDLTQTNASLLIYYPNGTLWSQDTQELSVDPSGNVEFSSFTLGANNASAGEYTVNVRWNDKNITQVGLFVLNFEVIHDTILDIASGQKPFVTPIFTGESILIKVNYSDLHTGEGIIDANVNYTIDNETLITGDMLYHGGGVYIAEIDTTNWLNGLYNVSISANKSYYKSQYEDQIIQLEVTETTIFKPDSTFKNVPWGTNTSLYLTYNGSNNQGIPGAIISCNWNSNYWSWSNISSGKYNYMLELNTTCKQFGIYTLTINVSKTGYENQEIYISINIREIYTNLTYSQPDPVGFKSNISILVNYGNIDSGNLIPGADILISNKFGSEYWNTGDYFIFMQSLGKYNVTFNTSIFESGGTFGIYVTASKSNYANATALINIFIGDISTYLDDIFINGQDKTVDKSIIVPIQSTVNISVKYIEAVTDSNIKNATVEILGGSFSDDFTELSNEYNLNIDTTDLGMGVKILTILAKKNGHTLASSDITIIIRSINTTIDMEEGGNLIQINLGQSYTLKIVLKDEDFGGNIIDALVRYTWEFGHGELEDLNSDGVYEVTFTNIPEGTFTVTIIASAGYDYDFEPFEITLIVSVSSGPNLSWLIYVLFGGIFGLVMVFTLYQTHYKYPPTVRKSRKIRKKIKKGKTTTPVKDIASREDLIKDYLESNVETIQLEKKTKNGLKEK